jgi:predicted ATPase
LIHVPGLRGNPERSYKVASSDSLYPGSFERYVASIIYKWKTTPRLKQRFVKLVGWLNQLGLASAIDVSSINETRLELKISRHKGCDGQASDYVNIADVGFGVSQTLPVLVALLTAKKGQVVYIEQPELHLHPRAQYELSKIIASAVTTDNIDVVIETHSSILIRGIQILVAKGEMKGDSVSLNWFVQDPKTGQTEITQATLDKYGAFGDWPEDFDSIALDVEQEYLDAVEEAANNED